MRLIDLDPRWLAEAGRSGQGLTFLCPHCRTSRLAVTFANPIDGGERLPLWGSGQGKRLTAALAAAQDRGQELVPPGFHWQRTGDTFEDLTLSPSVDCSASGHWHGFVEKGVIR